VSYFVIMNGKADKYRQWKEAWPTWTSDLSAALKFHDRQSAEDFARDDEDAWIIKEVQSAKPDILAAIADALGCFGNAAIGQMHNGTHDVACITAGLEAVAWRLKEHAGDA
jgi:hypothetical protein